MMIKSLEIEETLVRLENGVIYGPLSEARVHCREIVESFENRLSGKDKSGHPQSGSFIYIPKNVTVETHFSIRHILRDEENQQSSDLLIFEQGASAKVFTSFESHGDRDCDTLSGKFTRELFAERASSVELVDLYRLGEQSSLQHNNYANQLNDSILKQLSLTLSGANVLVNINCYLCGRGADNTTSGVYICSGNQNINLSTNIEHLEGDCTSDQRFKGLASGESTARFNGRIYVAKDAQRTQALQQNHNLLLNTGAHIYTQPHLEIYANDVKCSHGATVGQLNPEALYYMRQRGLSEIQARALQIRGFVAELLNQTKIEGLTEELIEYTERKISDL